MKQRWGRVNGCMCGSAVSRSPMSFAEDKQRAASSDELLPNAHEVTSVNHLSHG